MYRIVLSDVFKKKSAKLVKKDRLIATKLSKTLNLLQVSPKHSSLRWHKLSGENVWSVSVSRDIRILCHWSDGKIYCTDIGSHDDVYGKN